MEALKDSISQAREWCRISRPGVVAAVVLATRAGRPVTAGAPAPRGSVEAGFATVRNLGAKDYADIALRDAINDGDVIGPRMVASGPALGITGGHCDENLLPPAFHFQGAGVADGVEGVQHKVREVIK